MSIRRRSRQTALALAWAAVLALAVVPTVSRALAADSGAICTTRPDALPAASHGDACALCALAADAPPLVAAPTALPAAPAATRAREASQAGAFRSNWPGQRARDPPRAA